MADKQLISKLQEDIDAVQGSRRSGSEVAAAKARTAGCNDDDSALKKIVALVNVSDRSERAIRERLERCGFEEAEIDNAVSRAKDFGFIDDRRFAEVLIRSRIAQGKGSAGIERELVQNDIDPSSIAGWPHEFGVGDGEEFDRALQVLMARPPRSKSQRDGAFRKLVQKGYSASVASSAARAWSSNLD